MDTINTACGIWVILCFIGGLLLYKWIKSYTRELSISPDPKLSQEDKEKLAKEYQEKIEETTSLGCIGWIGIVLAAVASFAILMSIVSEAFK